MCKDGVIIRKDFVSVPQGSRNISLLDFLRLYSVILSTTEIIRVIGGIRAGLCEKVAKIGVPELAFYRGSEAVIYLKAFLHKTGKNQYLK